jgi:hypothetical protein
MVNGKAFSSRERGHLACLSACGGESALRGRIALPGDVSCRMQDTASETPALPYEEAASSSYSNNP